MHPNSNNIYNPHAAGKGVQNGLLFIPDISGFTALVHTTDVLTGRQITYELLSSIIDNNLLGLQIAEVEGDAILFYSFGPVPALPELLQQYDAMEKAFKQKCLELETRLSMSLHLSLKVIAHYGAMAEYEIGGYKKLFGEVVIEAHRLLKNSIASNTYFLLSDALKAIVGGFDNYQTSPYNHLVNQLCELYGGFKNLCFSYFDFSQERFCTQTA